VWLPNPSVTGSNLARPICANETEHGSRTKIVEPRVAQGILILSGAMTAMSRIRGELTAPLPRAARDADKARDGLGIARPGRGRHPGAG
jgi:hypothetical protein